MKKKPVEDPNAGQRIAEQVETIRAIMRHYANGMKLTFGAPTRCPECGDYGFVQGVNRGDGVSYNHCFGCQADWIISVAALRAYYADPSTPAPAPAEPAPPVETASPWFAEPSGDGTAEPSAPLPVLFDPGTEDSSGRVAKTPASITPAAIFDPEAEEPGLDLPAPLLAMRKAKPRPAEPAPEHTPTAPTPATPAAPEVAAPAAHAEPEAAPAPAARPATMFPPVAEPSVEPRVARRIERAMERSDERPVEPAAAARPVEPVAAAPAPVAKPVVDEPVAPAAPPAPEPEAPAAEAPRPRRLENPVLDAAMLAQLSRPGRVIEPTPPTPARQPDGTLRVIVAEDNPFDLSVLEELVEGAEPRAVELLAAATREEAERLASTVDHDLVLLDLDLPDSTGITTLLEWQHSAVSDAPVIILSGSNDPGVISEARALGAVHFIQKDQLTELADAGHAGAERLARLFRSTVKRAAAQPRRF